MMSDGDIISDHLFFLIDTLKSSSFLCSTADKLLSHETTV